MGIKSQNCEKNCEKVTRVKSSNNGKKVKSNHYEKNSQSYKIKVVKAWEESHEYIWEQNHKIIRGTS